MMNNSMISMENQKAKKASFRGDSFTNRKSMTENIGLSQSPAYKRQLITRLEAPEKHQHPWTALSQILF
jgi:hypothetical protein